MKFSIKDFFGKCDQIRRKLKRNKIILTNVRVASRVSKRLKTCGLRKFGDFKKIHETLGFDDTQLTTTQQANFDICAKTHKNLY